MGTNSNGRARAWDSIMANPQPGIHMMAQDFRPSNPHINAARKRTIPAGLEDEVDIAQSESDYKDCLYNSFREWRTDGMSESEML